MFFVYWSNVVDPTLLTVHLVFQGPAARPGITSCSILAGMNVIVFSPPALGLATALHGGHSSTKGGSNFWIPSQVFIVFSDYRINFVVTSHIHPRSSIDMTIINLQNPISCIVFNASCEGLRSQIGALILIKRAAIVSGPEAGRFAGTARPSPVITWSWLWLGHCRWLTFESHHRTTLENKPIWPSGPPTRTSVPAALVIREFGEMWPGNIKWP